MKVTDNNAMPLVNWNRIGRIYDRILSQAQQEKRLSTSTGSVEYRRWT